MSVVVKNSPYFLLKACTEMALAVRQFQWVKETREEGSFQVTLKEIFEGYLMVKGLVWGMNTSRQKCPKSTLKQRGVLIPSRLVHVRISGPTIGYAMDDFISNGLHVSYNSNYYKVFSEQRGLIGIGWMMWIVASI